MKKISIAILSLATTLSITACSQTVSSSHEEEIEPTFVQRNSSSDTNNKTFKNTDNNSDDISVNIGDDSNFSDFNDLFNSDNIEMSGTSTFSFTGEKVKCDFDVDDEEWNIDVEEENGVGHSLVTFDSKSMKIRISGSQEDSTAASCEASLAVAQMVLELTGMQDLDMSCKGKTMNFSGTIIDTTHTSADKKDVYNEICL